MYVTDEAETRTRTPSLSVQRSFCAGARLAARGVIAMSPALIVGFGIDGQSLSEPIKDPAQMADVKVTTPSLNWPVLSLPEYASESEIAPELQTFLDKFLRVHAEADDNEQEQILASPQVEQHRVRMRVRFVGEESPRIWLGDDSE